MSAQSVAGSERLERSSQSRIASLVTTESFWAVAFLLACLAFSLRSVAIGWNDEVGGAHVFRQTQTAFTTFFMVRQWPTLAYETPVLGPPWSIPMEFPVYQWLVAATVSFLNTPLPQTGRFISVLFFFLTALPGYSLLAALRVRRAHRLLVIGLWLVSPFYLSWARTFMIETTAVCLSTAYLAVAVHYVKRPACHLAIAAIACGCLGSMLKITTFVSFGLAASLFVINPLLRRRLRWRTVGRQFASGLLLVGIPLVAASLWTHYADGVKEQNVLGRYLTSAYLTDWYFGTTAQKLSPQIWRTIISRAPSLLTPDTAFWLAAGVAVLVTRRRWKETVICLLLYLSSPAIFTNLHLIHDYYMCANGIFLLAAVGFCIVGMLESRGGTLPGFAAATVALILAASYFNSHFAPMQRGNPRAGVSNPPRQTFATSDPESVTIYLGMDWAPIWPYHARRRALMIPEWPYVTESDVRAALARVKGYKINGVIVTKPSRYPVESLLKNMTDLGLDTSNVRPMN